MGLMFVALRSILFATGFLWLWTWLALLLRQFDAALGGPLPPFIRPAGFLALGLGATIVIWCIGAFIFQGHGTPALFDPPRRMVAAGPYRYARNPMYIGGALLLLGLGLERQSPSIVLFVPAWWLLFHLLVVLYEESVLRHKFGPEYDEYCRRTPRWIPRLHAAHAGFVPLLALFAMILHGGEPKPNFTGAWKLNPQKSDFGPLPGPDARTDRIEHDGAAFRLKSTQTRGKRESTGEWECRIDAGPCAVAFRGTEMKLETRATWDGAILVLASQGEYGGGSVRMDDRWTLSADGRTIAIRRQLSNDIGEAHQTVVLEKQ